jgi:hypothetical protein
MLDSGRCETTASGSAGVPGGAVNVIARLALAAAGGGAAAVEAGAEARGRTAW